MPETVGLLLEYIDLSCKLWKSRKVKQRLEQIRRMMSEEEQEGVISPFPMRPQTPVIDASEAAKADFEHRVYIGKALQSPW